jgi:hypothetical protein
VERKRLVIDANILIRGCLGVRVRTLIADYADRVDFLSPRPMSLRRLITSPISPGKKTSMKLSALRHCSA